MMSDNDTQVLIGSSVTQNFILLTAENRRTSNEAVWLRSVLTGKSRTYMGAGKRWGSPATARWSLSTAAWPSTGSSLALLVVELQILQSLCKGQFLLDGHTQEGVQGLLLIFCCNQLPLHVVQLCYVFITPGGEHCPERRECGGIFFKSLQLIPQLH